MLSQLTFDGLLNLWFSMETDKNMECKNRNSFFITFFGRTLCVKEIDRSPAAIALFRMSNFIVSSLWLLVAWHIFTA